MSHLPATRHPNSPSLGGLSPSVSLGRQNPDLFWKPKGSRQPQLGQLGCGHTSYLGQRVFLPRISFFFSLT